MAKLTVWLHQGTVIPSGHQQSGLEGAFTGSDYILKMMVGMNFQEQKQ